MSIRKIILHLDHKQWMKQISKSVLAMSLVSAMVFSGPVSSFAGTWIEEESAWHYQKDDGAFANTGWEKIDGWWYFFQEDGVMKTGWLKDQNRWYLLKDNGVMRTGWVKDQNQWYYLQPGGAMKTGWLKYQNKWYFLQSNGAMKTGWLKYQNKWYYLQSNGVMQTGWVKVGAYWYYLESSGVMVANKWVKYNGKEYYLNSGGKMETNKFIGKYYVDGGGAWVKATPDKAYTIDLGNNKTKKVIGSIDYVVIYDIFQQLNAYRRSKNLKELTMNYSLLDYANIRAYEIVNTFSHTRPNGKSALSFPGAYGENIAAGYGTATNVMTGWKNSPGHNENMLRPEFQSVAIGVFYQSASDSNQGGYGSYFVQLFGL